MRSAYWGDNFDTREKTVSRMISEGYIKPGDSEYKKSLDPNRNKPKSLKPDKLPTTS